MRSGECSIVVVPRERFSEAERSLTSILEHTSSTIPIFYVDGNMPRRARRRLETVADGRDVRFLHSDRYLSPNRARNVAIPLVQTRYTVFADNDLIVSEGWIDRLVDRAESTGAAAVGPLYLEGDPEDRIVHMAGGDLTLSGPDGSRQVETTHRHQGVALDALDAPLVAEPVDYVEFHCLLVRTDVFDRIGLLDEQLWSTREHLDLCLQLQAADEKIWFEPESVVTYSTPPPFELSDIPFFWTRWSESWTEISMDHFCARYGIDPEYKKRIGIMRRRRQQALEPVVRAAGAVLGQRGETLARKVIWRVEPRFNRLVRRR